MKTLRFKLVLLVAAGVGCLAAHARRANDEPLTIRSQGSFFVGGENKPLPAPPPGAAFGGGEITVNQMYVQYQIPARR